ncbi:uncharacterized protein LOC133534420 [Cydia pomonella]|uniref:uncharacterized protein LOC133534420 n=1 Tax=Cydia pomonella TaxID=82600 RepID=UPI002ADDA2F4|nr:uncharacterized protein LOC133534420 [Cydia pomonella]
MCLLFIILSVSYAAELFASKNVKLDADIHMDPTFIEFIKQGLDEELELGYFRSQSDGDGPIMEVIKDNALHEILTENLPEITSGGNSILAQIHKFEERSQQKGIDCIQAVADHVQNKLNLLQADLIPVVKKIKSDYITMLKKYFSDLDREKPIFEVDKEYIILDMVNVVCMIRTKIEKILLKRILALAGDTEDDEIEILTDTLRIFNDNDKRQEINFMCSNYKICRPNPAFSDYLFRFLDEVLKLDDSKFQHCLNRISQLLLTKISFFKTVLRDKLITFLETKLNNIASVNVNEMREVVSFLHSIVIRRYKINRTNDKKILDKAKSAYIILDIVDTAFGIDGDDIYGSHMEKWISLVRELSTNMRNDIETTLYDLIQYVVEAMAYNFTKRAKEEIMALADILFYGKVGKQEGTEYLFTEGSKFVKGLLHRSEPKKLW